MLWLREIILRLLTIASEMGIYNTEDIVVEGKDIRNLNDNDFNKVSVFARVAPSDKEIIINFCIIFKTNLNQ